MRWSVACAALVWLLAGCSEAAQPPDDGTQEDFTEFELEDTKEQLGVIRGIVVDAGVRPLAGAVVRVDGVPGNVTTKDAGTFAFKDLQPGVYFVSVTHARYKETQTSTEVVAGVKEPPVLRLRMERLPGTEPAIIPDTFQGHITCSIRVPAAGYNDGCVVFGNLGLGSTQEKHISFPPGNIEWIQVELAWTPNGATAERLCTTAWDAEMTPSGEGNVNNAFCGTSPVVRWMDQAQVRAADLDEEAEVRYTVYPDHLVAGASGNLVLEQEFQLLLHAFYNFVPPEGWQFGRDDLPPVPP